jgi:hypothetical protein
VTSSSSGAAFLDEGAGAATFLTRPFLTGAASGDFSLFLSSATFDAPFFAAAGSGSLSSAGPPASALILSRIGLRVYCTAAFISLSLS